MTQVQTPAGRTTGGKPINLDQLEAEINAAGVTTDGISMSNDYVFTHDAEGAPTDFDAAVQATVDQVIADHIALRDKTDAEYATEFQDAATTAVRRQEIRDITAGLLPREQVRVDNGLPLEDPPAEDDPLVELKAAHGVADLRDAVVAYLERFGG